MTTVTRTLLIGGLFLTLLNVPGLSVAGTTSGKVKAIVIHVFDNKFFVSLQHPHPRVADCAKMKRYVARTDRPGGKNALTAILAARAMGARLVIVGMKKCDIHHDSETIRHLRVVGEPSGIGR